MGAMTDYLENKIMDWLLRGQSYTPPATVYVALFTVAPDDAGGGTEVAGGGYARVGVACNATNWADTSGAGTTGTDSNAAGGTSGTTSNNIAITWPTDPTADWGQVVAFGLYDAASGGNLLIYADLTNAKTINNGDPAPSFPAGTLTYQDDT